MRLARNSHIPSKKDPTYNKCVRQRHAAILGICALVDSYPYTVEKWMPELLTNVLAEHTYDPVSVPVPRFSPQSLKTIHRFQFLPQSANVPGTSRKPTKILGTKTRRNLMTNSSLRCPRSSPVPLTVGLCLFIYVTCLPRILV